MPINVERHGFGLLFYLAKCPQIFPDKRSFYYTQRSIAYTHKQCFIAMAQKQALFAACFLINCQVWGREEGKMAILKEKKKERKKVSINYFCAMFS